MKIYTKKGDTGTTQLLGGSRISKGHLRIDAYGTVDELNSWLGLVRDQLNDEQSSAVLKEIQDRLFTIGSLLASDKEGSKMIIPDLNEEDVKRLEDEMDSMDKLLPELKSFVLPGGYTPNSICHIARCVCRRAERAIVILHQQQPVDELVLKYINRLSDYLFVLARKTSKDHGVAEIMWQGRKH